MRPTHLLILLTITLTILLLYTSPTEAKRRPPGRKRPPPTKVFPKKKARIFNPFLFRRNKAPGRRPKDFGGPQESKNVYYYSVPKVTQRPRIILGEELDFSSLGIHSNKPKPTGSLTSVQSALIEQELNEHDDLLPPSSYSSRRPHSRGPSNKNRQPKRTRGPGYRLRENRPWKDHYVLEHENRRPPKSSHPQVMSSMMKAAGEIRNAYKAAVIQSAKVAKFTGHTMGKYFKGVRNIFGGSGYDNGRSDTPYRKSSEASDVKNGVLTSDGLLEIPTTSSNSAEQKPPRKSNEDLSTDSSSGVLPNVYLDWGGSFWKFFYNKSKGINGKGSSLSEIEHDQSKQI